MALFNCSDCGKEVSDNASACVHCGCPIHNSEKNSNENVAGGSSSKWKTVSRYSGPAKSQVKSQVFTLIINQIILFIKSRFR